jgi:FkbM family methyltransferase
MLKKLSRKIIDRVNRRLGYIPASSAPKFIDKNSIHNLIEILKKCNYQPKVILDVGANHGNWTRTWKKEFNQSKFILVEPQNWLADKYSDLTDENLIYLPVGAGKESGKLLFTINSDRDDSSTFSMSAEEAKSRNFKQVEVDVMSINDIIAKNSSAKPDIIKIDAEGLDLEVLKGASEMFGHTELFLVECSINCMAFENSLSNVINFMEERGYRVFEITQLSRPLKSNILWLTEFAFVRKDGFFSNIDWKTL